MAAERTIGLHLPLAEQFSSRRIAGVLEYVAEHPELKIRDFCYAGNTPDISKPPPWRGNTHGVVLDVPRTAGMMPWLRRGNVPVVVASSDLSKRLFSVRINPSSIAKLAVRHFLELGRRYFVYVGHRPSDGSHDRRQALTAELAKHDVPLQSYETERDLTGTYMDFASLNAVEPGLLSLIRNSKKPLAVITIHDRYAVAICRIAEALDLSIPDDVAVLGEGDYHIGRLFKTPISSIDFPIERTGYEAARLLDQLMQGERPTRRMTWVPATDIVERESTIGKRRATITDVDRALEFVAQKACEGIRIRDVAAHVHMSLRTFQRQFADAAGQTIGEAIRDARLQRAKTLIATTDLPLDRLARLVGMNGAPHLNQFFRLWMQMTPGEYRRQQRESIRSPAREP